MSSSDLRDLIERAVKASGKKGAEAGQVTIALTALQLSDLADRIEAAEDFEAAAAAHEYQTLEEWPGEHGEEN